MMKIYCVAILFLSFILFISCEGNLIGEGFIVNQQTLEPIDSVYVEVLTGEDKTYSDTTGYYYVSNPFGKCIPKCTDIRIKFSKSGYQTIVKENPEDGDVIFLSPEN